MSCESALQIGHSIGDKDVKPMVDCSTHTPPEG
jgi:hypothetical protein